MRTEHNSGEEMKMHPYEGLEEKFIWATAVAKRNMFDIKGLWNPKFQISNHHKIITFGSCFAQHIGNALKSKGFNWLNCEPAPEGLSSENARKYNYGIFSARTGNIYTASLLQQWVTWATGESEVPDEYWENAGRYFDPFRPRIEPNGFLSAKELMRSRERTIEAFKECLATADIFVFTLGLTESWYNKEHGYEYPICPGTVAGVFEDNKHAFVHQEFKYILDSLADAIANIRKINQSIKILLTVSPVPLTATKSGNHVLVATMESKSLLRAVAGQMARNFDFIDYFPSYELINAAPYRGTFFEPNQRNVNHAGVDHVMKNFFECLHEKFPMQEMQPSLSSPSSDQPPEFEDKLVCEEELLSAFAK